MIESQSTISPLLLSPLRDAQRELEAALRNRLAAHPLSLPTRDYKSRAHEIEIPLLSLIWKEIMRDRSDTGAMHGLRRREPVGGLYSRDEILSEMTTLYQQGLDHPPAKLRALANATTDRAVDESVAQVRDEEFYDELSRNLKAAGVFWFREDPVKQLKLGFHTALSAFFKCYGSALALLHDAAVAGSTTARELLGDRERLQRELREMKGILVWAASTDLVTLHILDGALWDANRYERAVALRWRETDGVGAFLFDAETIRQLSAKIENAPVTEPRLGCPALRVKTEERQSLIVASSDWVEEILFDLYLPLL